MNLPSQASITRIKKMTDPRQGQKTIQSSRPWGDIHMVVRNQKCSVDLTEVKPGERASLHSHAIRQELFHPKAHEEFLIKPGQKHRFWTEDTIFRMLVVSFGEWKVEDQIRHEDDYGRKGETLKL
jgi:hypothetical protein